MTPRISIIVPTFREAENLPLLLPAIVEAMASRGWDWETIIVDENFRSAARSFAPRSGGFPPRSSPASGSPGMNFSW
jgi:hypothetical protein